MDNTTNENDNTEFLDNTITQEGRREYSHQVHIDGKVKLTKESEPMSRLNKILMGFLVVLIIVMIYLVFNTFSSNNVIMLRNDESINSYIEELREQDIKIHYRFIDPPNPTESIAGKIMRPVYINTDDFDKNEYVTIYLGSR